MNKPFFACGLLGVVPVLALFGCGSGSSTAPSNPPTTTPATNPTPAPTPTPNPFLAQCGVPTPPALYGMKLKIHIDNGYRKQLDSKPIVANIDGYCGKVGFGQTVHYCETRPEGSTEREACDALVVGKAADTGRVGPTWTWDGNPCLAVGDADGEPGCVNSDNQFLIVAKGPGEYLACASDAWPLSAPSSTLIEGGSRCGSWTVE
jgi:hypothetical protein